MSDTMEAIEIVLEDFKRAVNGLPIEFTLFDVGIKVWFEGTQAGCVMFTQEKPGTWDTYAVSIVGSYKGIFKLAPMAALARVLNGAIDDKLGI